MELISEGYDMAIRIGEMEDSTLRARKLAETTRRIVGAPSYFQAHRAPDADRRPQRAQAAALRAASRAALEADGAVGREAADPHDRAADRERRPLAAGRRHRGAGDRVPALLPLRTALRSGRIEEAIPALPRDVARIYAVYPPGRHVPPKVRAFIDFLAGRFADRGADKLVTG